MAEHHERYAEIGEAWTQAYRVSLKGVRKSLTGAAYVSKREIVVPWPATSRNRLYILAHEIGHVALGHTQSTPRYVKEYEAEQFAHALMRNAGLVVPQAMTKRAKRYVARCIKAGLVRGSQWIDPNIAEWCGRTIPCFTARPNRARNYFAAAKVHVAKALAGAP